MLCGYAWQIATASSTANMLAQKTICVSFLDSIGCAAMEATTISINSVAICTAIALAFKLKEVAYDDPKRWAKLLDLEMQLSIDLKQAELLKLEEKKKKDV